MGSRSGLPMSSSSSLGVLREEGRPVGKAKKAEIKEPNLHSSDRHEVPVLRLRTVNPKTDRYSV
jgi:hypothetical protein